MVIIDASAAAFRSHVLSYSTKVVRLIGSVDCVRTLAPSSAVTERVSQGAAIRKSRNSSGFTLFCAIFSRSSSSRNPDAVLQRRSQEHGTMGDLGPPAGGGPVINSQRVELKHTQQML